MHLSWDVVRNVSGRARRAEFEVGAPARAAGVVAAQGAADASWATGGGDATDATDASDATGRRGSRSASEPRRRRGDAWAIVRGTDVRATMHAARIARRTGNNGLSAAPCRSPPRRAAAIRAVRPDVDAANARASRAARECGGGPSARRRDFPGHVVPPLRVVPPIAAMQCAFPVKKPSTATLQRGDGEWLSCLEPALPAAFVSMMPIAPAVTRPALAGLA